MKQAPVASNVSICRKLALGEVFNHGQVFIERRQPRSSPSLGKRRGH